MEVSFSSPFKIWNVGNLYEFVTFMNNVKVNENSTCRLVTITELYLLYMFFSSELFVNV